MLLSQVTIQRGGWWYELKFNGQECTQVCKHMPNGDGIQVQQVWLAGQPMSDEAQMAVQRGLAVVGR